MDRDVFSAPTHYVPYDRHDYAKDSRATHTPMMGNYTSYGEDSYPLNPYPHTPQYEESNDRDDIKYAPGKVWRTGVWARFPWLGLSCLCVILGSLVGVIVILSVSEGKRIDTWGSAYVNIAHHKRRWQISVNAWISILNFIMSQALIVMLADAVAVSWWVDALRGQTLERLHYQWEVGQSWFKMLQRRRFRGWISVASIGFLTFTGLEALLQTASFPSTVLNPYNSSMKTTFPNALPAGFSGVIAATGHGSFGPLYYTPEFVQVLQNYSTQSPVQLDVDGCPSDESSFCYLTLPGIGFNYNCTSSRSDAHFHSTTGVGPQIFVFNVKFKYLAGSINLTTSWKDTEGDGSSVIANRTCLLTPAIVEYPLNISRRIVSLQAPSSSTLINGNLETLRVDKVIETLPYLEYDKSQDGTNFLAAGSHTTVGGIGLALSRLFDSSISTTWDPTNPGARVGISGSFVAPYARFPAGTQNSGMMNNTFDSPMPELLKNIRDIMFRSTVAIVQHNISDYALSERDSSDNKTLHVPANMVEQSGQYWVLETVYEVNRTILGVGVGLMVLAMVSILPLYFGFWRLGRQVTLAPLETAKALHGAVIINTQTERKQAASVLDVAGRLGSNFSARKLVKVLGKTRVKYGEVEPDMLAIGLIQDTKSAKKGHVYH